MSSSSTEFRRLNAACVCGVCVRARVRVRVRSYMRVLQASCLHASACEDRYQAILLRQFECMLMC